MLSGGETCFSAGRLHGACHSGSTAGVCLAYCDANFPGSTHADFWPNLCDEGSVWCNCYGDEQCPVRDVSAAAHTYGGGVQTFAKSACVDKEDDWANGYEACGADGFGADEGCSPAGWTCAGYVFRGHCDGTGVVPGHEWAMGDSFNNPEKNCCACGGGDQYGGIPRYPTSQTSGEGECSSDNGSLSWAQDQCAKTLGCTYVHDMSCDGKNYRVCKGQRPAEDETASHCFRPMTPKPGPKNLQVYRTAAKASDDPGCSSDTGDFEWAMLQCKYNDCTYLHDISCDGQNYRYCTGELPTEDPTGSHCVTPDRDSPAGGSFWADFGGAIPWTTGPDDGPKYMMPCIH